MSSGHTHLRYRRVTSVPSLQDSLLPVMACYLLNLLNTVDSAAGILPVQ